MNADLNNNAAPLARWIRTDGSTVEGPAQDLMRDYAAAGFAGRLVAVDAALGGAQ